MESLTEKETRRKLHRVWRGMKERCSYVKHKSYGYYGGRGITVCDEWAKFEPFFKWAMANGYKPGLKLDRKDNDGPYTPGNCRFVTHKVNMNNTSRVRLLELAGKVQNAGDWANEPSVTVSRRTINRRVRKGRSIEQAILKPVEGRYVEAFGESKTLTEWTRDPRCKVNRSCFLDRFYRNWDIERALTVPNGEVDHGGLRFTAFGETKTLTQWARDPRCVVKPSTLNRRVLNYGVPIETALTTPKGKLPKAAAGEMRIGGPMKAACLLILAMASLALAVDPEIMRPEVYAWRSTTGGGSGFFIKAEGSLKDAQIVDSKVKMSVESHPGYLRIVVQEDVPTPFVLRLTNDEGGTCDVTITKIDQIE